MFDILPQVYLLGGGSYGHRPSFCRAIWSILRYPVIRTKSSQLLNLSTLTTGLMEFNPLAAIGRSGT